MTRDERFNEARAAILRFAQEASRSADANHAARGRLLLDVLIPFTDWLGAEESRGSMDKGALLAAVVTGFGAATAMTLTFLGAVKSEEVEELADTLSCCFYAELADSLRQALAKMEVSNRSIN